MSNDKTLLTSRFVNELNLGFVKSHQCILGGKRTFSTGAKWCFNVEAPCCF